MGLDCTAYRNVKLIATHREEDEDGEYCLPDGTLYDWDEHITVYVNPHFPERAIGLVHRGVYTAEDSMGWRAGSYGGYTAWRKELAALVGLDAEDIWEDRVTSGPFYELICFSDCDGTLNADVCARLHADFVQYEKVAEEKMDDYSLQRYREWKEACAMAAQNGFITFH